MIMPIQGTFHILARGVTFWGLQRMFLHAAMGDWVPWVPWVLWVLWVLVASANTLRQRLRENPYLTSRASSSILTPAKAFDTGHPFLASSARR